MLTKDQIEDNLRILIMHHPPFGYPIAYLRKRYSERFPAAAGVTKDDIYVNPKLLEAMTESKTKKINFVFSHEFCHIWDEHIPRTMTQLKARYGEVNLKRMTGEEKKKVEEFMIICNVLQDALINDKLNILANKHSMIEMPDGLWTCDRINEKFKLDPPITLKSVFEEHIDNMIKNNAGPQLSPGDIRIEVFFDENTGDLLDKDGQLLKLPDNVKDALRKEIVRGIKQDELNRARGEGGADWSTIFPDLSVNVEPDKIKRELLARVSEVFGPIRAGLKRKMHPSRKVKGYPYTFKPRKLSSHVVFLIDTSGSVQGYIDKFYGALVKIQKKLKLTVTVVPCDAQVGEIYENVKNLPSEFPNSGGGTDLTVALNWIEEHCKDNLQETLMIVMTDGETPWRAPLCAKTIAVYTPHHADLKPLPYKSIVLDEGDKNG
jgi:predicted metal-dependent peptidase